MAKREAGRGRQIFYSQRDQGLEIPVSTNTIHVWFGFPCVGLSSVRAGRLNLDDPESGLFWEAVRIGKTIRHIFGYNFGVLFAGENVASMDRGEASLHGSGFCGADAQTSVLLDQAELEPMEGVAWKKKSAGLKSLWRGLLLRKVAGWKRAVWPGLQQGAMLPTCMKCIKRSRPPPSPAGIDRVDLDGKLRWEADNYKFPPYQYHSKFIVWVGSRWRLANATERELLRGLGFEHTILCWNAGASKANPQEFEDQQKTLVGDSFSCFSFVYIAALLCIKHW